MGAGNRPDRLAAVVVALAVMSPAAADPLPDGFVRLIDVAPTIRQDIRYATAFNFTGRVVPGYGAAQCILTRTAAEALKRADAAAAREGLRLVVFDCYRPRRAVAAFVAYAEGEGPAPTAGIFHPDVARQRLIAEGYIARVSAHARGSTVDVGLIGADAADWPKPRAGGRCDGPPETRARESDRDMGTAFDCFSPRSHVASGAVGATARHNRRLLARLMTEAGFRGYAREWWHFTLNDEPFPRQSFDFPIR